MILNRVELLYLGSRILGAPLEALFLLLIFILSKEMGASALQLTLLACAKPIVSFFSFYASSWIAHRSDRIRPYLFGMTCLASFPTLLFPLIDSVWFYILSYALFMTAQRAAFPGWNQLLKENLGASRMASSISKGVFLNYLLIMAVSLTSSLWLDDAHEMWRGLFFSAGLFKTLNFLLIYTIRDSRIGFSTGLKAAPASVFLLPWKRGFKLLGNRPDFKDYLALYFLGGVGIIATQPILPLFFSEAVRFSYTELAIAIAFCKGAGFLLTSEMWGKLSLRISLYRMNGLINLFSTLYFLFLIFSGGNKGWIYFAFFVYGTMQGGSEMSWNLSGPFFSRKEDSSVYSALNLVLVGIRGAICPALAQLLFFYTNVFTVFVCSGGVCLISLFYSLWLDQKYKRVENVGANQ